MKIEITCQGPDAVRQTHLLASQLRDELWQADVSVTPVAPEPEAMGGLTTIEISAAVTVASAVLGSLVGVLKTYFETRPRTLVMRFGDGEVKLAGASTEEIDMLSERFRKAWPEIPPAGDAEGDEQDAR